MLIIEIDGITHDTEETIAKDQQRENDLQEAGFKIVRFTDDEVLGNIAGVTNQLDQLIEKIETSTPCPRQRGTVGIVEGDNRNIYLTSRRQVL
jgi:very-short-patch-repair endonuclease